VKFQIENNFAEKPISRNKVFTISRQQSGRGDKMIDWSKVEELRNKIGVDDFDKVVELFLSEVEDRIDVTLTKADSESFEEDLHFLKGSALNLGFDQFAQLCGAGEQQAANSVPFDRMDEISSAYQNSKNVPGASLAGRCRMNYTNLCMSFSSPVSDSLTNFRRKPFIPESQLA